MVVRILQVITPLTYAEPKAGVQKSTQVLCSSRTCHNSLEYLPGATVFIRYGGLTVLTDPTLLHQHEQVDMGYGMHSTRSTNPAMDIPDLPAPDLILLSHFHGDHFDQMPERELPKSYPIVTTNRAACRDLSGVAEVIGKESRHFATICGA